MRLDILVLMALLLLLTACGSEDELIPPVFGNITVNGSAELSTSFRASTLTMTGTVDDVRATLVAKTVENVEVSIPVNSTDGRWSLTFSPQEGVNLVTLTASDKRGNVNQMLLNVLHDSLPPLVTSVTQDLTEPASPRLIVLFNEPIHEESLTNALFAVNQEPLSPGTVDSLTQKIVTIPLRSALAPGDYQLNCVGVTDLADTGGNSLLAGDTFSFSIVE